MLVYGVGGVGKTSFLLHAAERVALRNGATVGYHACRRGESLATVVRELLERPTDGRPARGPLEALAQAAEAAPLILILDDAHRVDDPALLEAVIHLVTLRLPLWICVASRVALPVSPASVDHLVLRLGGLVVEESRALCTALEKLYGAPSLPFEQIVRRGAGNPLLIKQAFGGPIDLAPADPLGLSELPETEAEVLSQLCAFRRPVSFETLSEGRSPDAVREAVQHLGRRFLVELPGDGAVAVHDLVREGVERSPCAPGAQEHQRCLAHYTARSRERDEDDACGLEQLHHAILSGRDAFAEEILQRHASLLSRLLPVGAVAEQELAEAVDQLGSRRPLSVPLHLLRARIWARQGQVARAYEEAAALSSGADPLLELDLGEMAFVLGRYARAIEHLSRAASSDQLILPARVWTWVLLVDALRSHGAMEAAERALADAAPLFEQAGTVGEGLRAWLEGGIAHDCQRREAAAKALSQALRKMEVMPFVAARVPFLSLMERAVAAASGRPAVTTWDATALFDDTLFLRLAGRTCHVEELLFRGQVRTAMPLAAATMEATGRASFRAMELWVSELWGEVTRVLGRPQETVARLEPLASAADNEGLHRTGFRLRTAVARARLAKGELERARRLALDTAKKVARAPGTLARLRAVAALAQAAEGAPEQALAFIRARSEAEGIDRAELDLAKVEVLLWAGRRGAAEKAAQVVETAAANAEWALLACRARLLRAEAVCGRGDLPAARSLWEQGAAAAKRDGYAAEHILAELLGAALARGRGELGESARHLTGAHKTACEQGFAIEAETARYALEALRGESVVAESPGGRLGRRLGLLQPTTCALREGDITHWLTAAQAVELDERPYALLVDLVRRRITIRRRRVDFTRREALLGVVRALARSPGEVVSVEVLVKEAWRAEYHPARHRSRITVSIARLRQLLGSNSISAAQNGYALATPGRWAVLAAVAPPEP